MAVDQQPELTIEINSLLMRAYHGVLPLERTVGADFRITLHVSYPPALEATQSDSLSHTLNYATLVDIIRQVMLTPSALLEHVCGRIRQQVCSEFPLITSGMVKVEKLSPPIPGVKLESTAVTLHW